MRARKFGASIGALTVALVTALTTTGNAAGASSAAASTVISKSSHTGYSHANPKTMGHSWVRTAASDVKSGTVRSADVAPLGSYSPACYGDSRSIAPVGGTFDPISFGAFYSCNQNIWTFELQTQDIWNAGSFGDFEVGINTDGDVAGTSNCGGVNYIARFYQVLTQSYGPTGTFGARVSQVDANCNVISQTGATPSMTSNAVAISFSPSSMGNHNSFAWNGYIQSFTQWSQSIQTQGATFDANFVPSSSFVDTLVQGAVLESLPGASPSCPAAYVGQSYVVNTANSSRALSALNTVGVRDVRDTGEGVVSFKGDPAAARSALAAAGIASDIGSSHVFSELSTFSGTTTPPNDPQYGNQWNLAAVGAPGAWAVTTGNGIAVAVVDSGVDYTNPDLAGNLLQGFDETTNMTMGASGSGAQETGNLDSDGHGTAVAGVVAAVTNNGAAFASLGWNTKVLPVKVDLNATNASAQVESGIKWAADNGAKVIDLSFGSVCPDSSVLQGVQYAQGKGALVVAAAGNGAIYPALDTINGQNNSPIYPAADPGVLAVGATGEDGFRAGYSNTGTFVSLVAPGGNGSGADDIPLLASSSTSCTNTPSTVCTTHAAGTSFSAPLVAATASLILSVNPGLSANQVSELITGSATDLGPPGSDIEYGAGMLNASGALADTPPATAGYGTFVSVPPARVLDTRFGVNAPQAMLGPGQTLNVTVAGAGGVPSSGVSAVVINTTVTNPTNASYLTVWPTGQGRPNSSNLNFSATQTVPNLVTVKVGSNGQISFFNAAGSTDVLADVAGYYVDGTGPAGSTFVPVAPTRILDTRSTTPVSAGSPRALQVSASGGLVPLGATGIVANVTITSPTANSYLTAYPSDGAVPNASNLNFVVNQTVPNLVSVKLSSSGQVNFFNAAGNVQVIVDLQGYFTAAGDTSGSRYFPVVNHRILDDRFNIGGFYGPIGQNQSISVPIVGQGGALDGAASAVMNTTVTAPSQFSYLTVYPDGTPVPYASNLNFAAEQTIANLVTAKIGSNGHDGFYNAAGSAYAIADIMGYYGAPGT